MVTTAGAGGASQEEGGGRTAASLHEEYSGPYHSPSPRRPAGGSVDAIAQRLDGAYIPDTGDRNAQPVHGWFYPDPRSRALPEVHTEAS